MKKKIYITVKTYPNPSKKYDEIVCTAGITEDGQLIRIYPIPFRKFEYESQYKKYHWTEWDIIKNEKDSRPESFRPIRNKPTMVENNNLKPDWNYRKQVILNGQKIYTNKAELLSDLKSQNISLAIFKPSKLLDISFEEVEREWSREVLSAIKMRKNQISFFQNNTDLAKEIRLVKKVPYKIKIKFADNVGEPSNLMIEDWEIGALFWNCMKSSNNDEKVALQKVKEKYQKIFDEDDVYLFLGTTLEYHYRGRNPFIIIGIFHPPKDNQISFFDNFNYPENS